MGDVHLIKAGEKVGGSEATLLGKLGIKPFSYGLVIQQARATAAASPRGAELPACRPLQGGALPIRGLVSQQGSHDKCTRLTHRAAQPLFRAPALHSGRSLCRAPSLRLHTCRRPLQPARRALT